MVQTMGGFSKVHLVQTHEGLEDDMAGKAMRKVKCLNQTDEDEQARPSTWAWKAPDLRLCSMM